MKMPFGRYRGQPLADLPDEYLDWLQGLDLRDPLRMGVERESLRRLGATGLSAEARVLADMIVTLGYSRLERHYEGDGLRAPLDEARDALLAWLDAGENYNNRREAA